MSHPNSEIETPKHQDAYWYPPEANRHKEEVDLAINIIADDSRYGTWAYPSNMNRTIDIVQDNLLDSFAVLHNHNYIRDIVQFLWDRHTVWEALVANDLVLHNPVTNNLHASKSVWKFLYEVDNKVIWYKRSGEPAASELQVIFEHRSNCISMPPGNNFNLDEFQFDDTLSLSRSTSNGPRIVMNLQASPRTPLQPLIPSPDSAVKQLTRDKFTRSVSNSKTKRKLIIGEPRSPLSSVGSSSAPKKNLFEEVKMKYGTCN